MAMRIASMQTTGLSAYAEQARRLSSGLQSDLPVESSVASSSSAAPAPVKRIGFSLGKFSISLESEGSGLDTEQITAEAEKLWRKNQAQSYSVEAEIAALKQSLAQSATPQDAISPLADMRQGLEAYQRANAAADPWSNRPGNLLGMA